MRFYSVARRALSRAYRDSFVFAYRGVLRDGATVNMTDGRDDGISAPSENKRPRRTDENLPVRRDATARFRGCTSRGKTSRGRRGVDARLRIDIPSYLHAQTNRISAGPYTAGKKWPKFQNALYVFSRLASLSIANRNLVPSIAIYARCAFCLISTERYQSDT